MRGVEILERPALMKSTRHVITTRAPDGKDVVVCWSLSVFRVLMAPLLSGVVFAKWHDDQQNCATWTDEGGCRCEVDP